MDPEAMSKYTWAILDHYPSTVENTKHDNLSKKLMQLSTATKQS